MIFAIIDPQTPAILAAFGAMLLGFYGIAKLMLKQASVDREADRVERQAFAKAIEHMAVNSGKVAESNKLIAQGVNKQAKESETRNGHLAELIVKQADATEAIANKAVKSIVDQVQHVKQQDVEHQTIKHKD